MEHLAPDAEWQVWYEDTFDRECPRSVDASGRGLVQGLMELWARHLCERVRADGGKGFSRFNLWWAQGSIEIAEDREGAARLRGWVYGEVPRVRDGYVAGADARLLSRVAAAHAHLVLSGRRVASAPILDAAAAAADRRDFEARLAGLSSRGE
jgi:hypothetical protein